MPLFRPINRPHNRERTRARAPMTAAIAATLALLLCSASLQAGERPSLGLASQGSNSTAATTPQTANQQANGPAADNSQPAIPPELASGDNAKAVRKELLRRFDSNGDGTLDESEREAMRAALKKRLAKWRQQLPAEADSDGDGSISKEEARSWFQAQKAAYDVDGDGSLNKEERQAFKQHLEELGLAGLVGWAGKQGKRP